MKSHRVLFALCLFCGMVSGTNAQDVDTMPPRGFLPNHDQMSGSIDNIDLVSGKLNLTLPLGSLPRGRGGSGYDLNLRYESNRYDLDPHEINVCAINTNTPGCALYRWAELKLGAGGWDYGLRPYKVVQETKTIYNWIYHPNGEIASDQQCPNGATLYRHRILLPDGSLHILYLRGYEYTDNLGSGFYPITLMGTNNSYSCQSYLYKNVVPPAGWLTYYTNDGSYLKLETWGMGATATPPPSDGAQKLYLPDGRIVAWESGVLREYDANGNHIAFENVCQSSGYTCAGGASSIEKISNSTGQAIFVRRSVARNGSWTRDQVIIPGPNGDSVYSLDWTNLSVPPITYETGVVPEFYTNPSPDTQYRTLNVSGMFLKYVQLPTAAPSPLGTPPPTESSYEFGYKIYGESCAPGSGQSPGLGELNYMRTPSGSVYTYVWDLRWNSYSPYSQAAALAHSSKVCKKRIIHDSGQTLQWQFENDEIHTAVTSPDGGRVVYHYTDKGSPAWNGGLANLVEEFDAAGRRLRARRQLWAQNPSYNMSGRPQTPNNPYMSKESVIVYNSSGTGVKSAITTYSRDKNGRLAAKTEYDWAAGVTTDESGAQARRVTLYDYWLPLPAASSTADHADAWWNVHNTSRWPARTARRLDAVRRVTVYDGGGVAKAATEYTYDYPYSKGNVTAERRWDSVKAATLPTTLGSLAASNSQSSSYYYDGYGNVTDSYGPAVGAAGQPRTHVTYDSTGARVEKVETGYGTTAKRTTGYAWYNGGAALWAKTDVENNVATVYEYDDAGRVTLAMESSASGGLRLTETVYDDANRTVAVTGDLRTFGDGKLKSVTYHDKLGRVRLSQETDGAALTNEASGIKVKTIESHPTGGRRVITTTPHRSLNDTTLEWSCTQYDTLGRVAKVATYKGSAQPTSCDTATNRTGVTTTTYDGDWTTVTDPAGKVRRQRVDGLGRLVEVVEAPSGLNYSTTYAYDALDNLTAVTQGTQTRTFAYSSLGRLTSATNPESGTTGYLYHDSGDLKRKTDARSRWTEMVYDVQHQILTKTYSDGTPAVTYTYHATGAPNIGRLKSVSSSVATTTYGSYDALGRVTASSHAVAGANTAAFGYTWHLNDGLKSVTYPSTRVVNYTVDDAGRTNKAYSGATAYADMTVAGMTYPFAADGRVSQVKLGNGLYETYDYRTPGTATAYKLGTTMGGGDLTQLEYDFSGTANNGNVLAHRVWRSGTAWSGSQGYSYDALNRLSYASESGGWYRTYGYDRYGNRYVTTPKSGPAYAEPTEPTSSSHFNAANNRLNMTGASYDASGNQTAYDGLTLEYDAEGRNTKVKEGNSDYVTFAYDGEGRRVKKVSGGVTTYYIHDALGRLAMEYSNQAPASTGVSYLFTDMLGSVRTITDAAGAVVECYDYMPFGRMLTASDNGRSAAGCYPAAPDPADSRASQKFTGKERDAETGLDYFGARYYSGALGRFTSPDPLYIEARRLADPQQLNLYAYVRNNPLKLVDPTGMYIDFDCDTSDNCDEAVEMFNSRNGGQFTVGLGKNNRLEVIGDVNRKELGKAEKALFDAITDDKKGGILQVSGDTGRSDFGAFEGIGLNSVDLGNLSKLDAANGSINSGDVIAHEGLEGYFSLSTKNFGKAHNEVLKKGLLGLTKTGYEYGVSRGALSGDRTWYDISGGRGSMSVTTKLITPIPTQSLSGYPLPTRESMIENAPRRVEEVQFVP